MPSNKRSQIKLKRCEKLATCKIEIYLYFSSSFPSAGREEGALMPSEGYIVCNRDSICGGCIERGAWRIRGLEATYLRPDSEDRNLWRLYLPPDFTLFFSL
jgi:hypothetical protein